MKDNNDEDEVEAENKRTQPRNLLKMASWYVLVQCQLALQVKSLSGNDTKYVLMPYKYLNCLAASRPTHNSVT